MIVTYSRLVTVALIVAGLALAVQTCRYDRAAKGKADAEADAQAAKVTAAGWYEAARASQRRFDETVPALLADMEKARELGARPAVAMHTQTGEANFGDPCGDTPPIAAGSGEGTATVAGTTPPPAVTDLRIKADVQTAVSLGSTGSLFGLTKVTATATRGNWTRTMPLPDGDVRPDFIVDPKLQAVLERGLAPAPRKWGWTVGASGGVSLAGDPFVGPTVTWGRRIGR